jgi:hypothetical protein
VLAAKQRGHQQPHHGLVVRLGPIPVDPIDQHLQEVVGRLGRRAACLSPSRTTTTTISSGGGRREASRASAPSLDNRREQLRQLPTRVVPLAVSTGGEPGRLRRQRRRHTVTHTRTDAHRPSRRPRSQTRNHLAAFYL